MWEGARYLSAMQRKYLVFLLLARTGFEPNARSSEMWPGCVGCVIVDQRPHITTVLVSRTQYTHTTGINAEFKDSCACLQQRKTMSRSGLGLCVNLMARGAVPLARFTVARAPQSQLKRTKRMMLPGTVIISNRWHPTEELKYTIEIGADLVVLQACLGF